MAGPSRRRGASVLAGAALVVAFGLSSARADTFKAEDLAKARTFIEMKMEASVRDQLKEMALKQGMTPEELFLTIRAMSKKEKTLGTGSDAEDTNVPDARD